MQIMDYREFFMTDNKSGWKGVESKLFNKHPEIHGLIIKYGNEHKLGDIPFVRKVYHFINDIKVIPVCAECGSEVKFLRLLSGYQEFCGLKCSNKNLKKIESNKLGLIEKYGVDTTFKIPEVSEDIRNKNISKFGVDNVFKLTSVQDDIRKIFLERYGDENILKTDIVRKSPRNKKPKVEKSICEKLSGESGFNVYGKEYDILLGDDIIEIDGDYFHPSKLENLSLIQLNTVLNDKIKTDILDNTDYNLIRVKVSKVEKLNDITIDTIKDISYTPDYTLSYNQKIMTKEYLSKYIVAHGKDKLSSYLPLLLRFIREFNPEFPYPDTVDDLNDVMDKINKFDSSKFHNKETNSFNNNTYTAGVSYLKSIFRSYWNSSFKNNITPIEYWNDDNKMLKVIAYRIGLNDNNEVYDLSLKNLIRGISAVRGTVSFFKPIVASGIYKHYLGDKINPTVFDPCCGFGGRLLGFKSTYRDGTYIGCEPNIGTFNELTYLSNRLGKASVFNCKLEDLNIDFNYDIAFTSIPYFDLEDYNNGVEYKDFTEWVDTFISKLINLPKVIINMPYDICEKLNLTEYIDGYLVNSKTHFNDKDKKEVLVKLNF